MEDPPPCATRMQDGSELFPVVWNHFMSHAPIRAWLMNGYLDPVVDLRSQNIDEGIAVCCNFPVPKAWSALQSCFDLGEIFVPNHSYQHFSCGTMLAATTLHKHLMSAIGDASEAVESGQPEVAGDDNWAVVLRSIGGESSLEDACHTRVRRMAIDMGSARSINILEFCWMRSGMLLVTAKIIVPPQPGIVHQSSGCSGAFAIFLDAQPGGEPPERPTHMISFLELPRCPFCEVRGSSTCVCRSALGARGSRFSHSSAILESHILSDLAGTGSDTLYNVRRRIEAIQHMGIVKVTVHKAEWLNTHSDGESEETFRLHALPPAMYKPVLFRPSDRADAVVLRQVVERVRTSCLVYNSFDIRIILDAMQRRNKQYQLLCHMDEAADGPLTIVLDEEQTSAEGIVEDQEGEDMPAVTVLQDNTPSLRRSRGDWSDLQCDRCDKIFFKSGTLVRHQRDVHSARSNSCGPRRDLSGGDYSAGSSAPSFACRDTVGKSRGKRDGVEGVQRIACPRCEKTFSQQGSLNRHLRSIHEYRKLQCNMCELAFGQGFDLKVSFCFTGLLAILFY